MPSTSHPFAIADYRKFWLARFMAVMATMAMVVIIGWQVYDVARTDYAMSPKEAAFQLGLVGLFQFVPLLLLMPVTGWAADRFERRKVAIFANMIDGSVALGLALGTTFDLLNLPLLFLLASMHGAARGFVGPAMSAIYPNILPAEMLPRGIALNSIAWQTASVAGPAAGGFLYAAGPAIPYWTATALLALASISVASIKPVYPPPIEGDRRPVKLMLDGMRYTWNERFLLGAISLDLFAVLLGGATALLPVYARDILHVGAEGLGYLRAAPGFGAAIVALWLAFRPLKYNVGVKMLWAVVIFGIGTMAFGLSHKIAPQAPMPFALAMLALLGGADMLSVFVRGALVQLNTPDSMRGRVSSVSGLFISASNELGEMQSGIAAALLGPVGAVVAGGAGAIAVTGLWTWLFPELKNARTFEPQFRDPPKEQTP